MKKITQIILFAALVVMSSCNKDHSNGADGDYSVILKVSVPKIGSPTRAMTATQEDAINTIDVLAFVKDNNDYRYAYTAQFVKKDVSGSNLLVTVKAQAYSVEQKFVILVNASSILSSAGINQNELLESAVKKLVCTTGGGEFVDTNVPMYAQTTPKIVANTGSIIGDPTPFPLIRMVARIDVKLAAAVNNFKLTEASLFNHKNRGYLAYDFSGFSGDRASVAAVPAGANSGTPILEPQVTYPADYGADTRGEILSSIYTFESPAYTEADKLTGTAIVIGGKFGTTPAEIAAASDTYYRVNIKTTDDLSANAASHILRNHKYTIIIQSVDNPGSASPLDAYKSLIEIGFKVIVDGWEDVELDTELL